MSERALPVGQYVPPISNSPISSSPLTQPTNDPGNLSFQQVLNRQQTSSTQVKSIPNSTLRPGNSFYRTSVRPGMTPNAVPKNGSVPQNYDPTLMTPPAKPGEIVLTSPPDTPVAADTQWLNQSSQMIRTMPKDIPQGSEFEKQILNNYQEYLALKQKEVSQNASNSAAARDLSKTMRPPADAGLKPRNAALTPVSSEENLETEPASPTTAAFNSVFSGNAEETPSVKRVKVRPLQEEASETNPVSTPAVTVPVYSKPAAKVPTLAPKQAIQEKADNSETDVQKTPAEKPKKKGFFNAVGSFFGDLASGLSLGFYRPNGDAEPTGAARVFYPMKKLLWDAPIKDLAVGVPEGLAYSAVSPFQKSGSKADGKNEPAATPDQSPPQGITPGNNKITRAESSANSESPAPQRRSTRNVVLEGYRPIASARTYRNA